MRAILYYNGLIISFILAVLVGCVSLTPVRPGAENVTITKDPVSKNCQWRGKVSAMNGSRSMRPDQHSTLLQDDFNRLRNQAMKLGANTVVLTPSSGMTDKKHWASKSEHKTVAAHAFTGNAYRCPAN